MIFITLVTMIILHHSWAMANGVDQTQAFEQEAPPPSKPGVNEPKDVVKDGPITQPGQNPEHDNFQRNIADLLASVGEAQKSIDGQIGDVKVTQDEIDKLLGKVGEPKGLFSWQTAIVGVMAFVASLFATLIGGWVNTKIAKKNRVGALDQAVHEARLKAYPKLVEATAGFAVFFPNFSGSITSSDCEMMGKELSQWYFQHGGLLLTKKSRPAFFRLAKALTKASKFKDEFCVPKFPLDANNLNVEDLNKYRICLKDHYGLKLDSVEEWTFGGSALTNKKEHESSCDAEMSAKFKDFVFLQKLCSDLRTKLIADTNSRKPPEGEDDDTNNRKLSEKDNPDEVKKPS